MQAKPRLCLGAPSSLAVASLLLHASPHCEHVSCSPPVSSDCSLVHLHLPTELASTLDHTQACKCEPSRPLQAPCYTSLHPCIRPIGRMQASKPFYPSWAPVPSQKRTLVAKKRHAWPEESLRWPPTHAWRDTSPRRRLALRTSQVRCLKRGAHAFIASRELFRSSSSHNSSLRIEKSNDAAA